MKPFRFAIVLSAAAVALAALLVLTQAEKPPESAVAVPHAPPERSEKVRLLVRTDGSLDSVQLCDSLGTYAATLTFDERGQAVTEPLVPGVYCLAADALTAVFSLRENAAVGVFSGSGGTDGESVYFGTSPPAAFSQ